MADKQTKGAAAASNPPAAGGKKAEESKKGDVKDVLATEELVSLVSQGVIDCLMGIVLCYAERGRSATERET